MAKFYGAQIGIVVNGLDPQGKGRAQVRLPSLGTADSSWAPVCRPFGAVAGGGPQVGASVVVLFENGDPDRPIVLGRID